MIRSTYRAIGAALLSLLILAIDCQGAAAQDRQILATKDVSPPLKAMVDKIANLGTPTVSYADLKRTSPYFVRIAPRAVILDENNRVKDGAILGTRPFVFVTTPESIYGKSLLDIYLDIGYEAEDIIHWQRGVDMVALVFRFPDGVTISDVTNGALPERWRSTVLIPTWDNIISLFNKLAAEAPITPDKKGEFAPDKLFFRSAAERDTALKLSPASRQRIVGTPYVALKAAGGPEWAYRDLLEKKLSAFEHFRGTGRTQNEVTDPSGTDPLTGLLEFVGPNQKVQDLPELAIVHLGALTMQDSYSPAKP